MFIIVVTMATELTDRQNFYKIQQFQSKLSCLYKQEYGLFIHILASPHLINEIKKIENNKNISIKVQWQPNHQIVSDFWKKTSIFKAKYLP